MAMSVPPRAHCSDDADSGDDSDDGDDDDATTVVAAASPLPAPSWERFIVLLDVVVCLG